MTGELIKLTGRGYLKRVGHTGLDGDPMHWKTMQLEAMIPLFVRNELHQIFHQKFTATGSFYRPSQWFDKEDKPLHQIRTTGFDNVWTSSMQHRENDYRVLVDGGVSPLQASLLLPTLMEYITTLTEPLQLEQVLEVLSTLDKRSPDTKIVLGGIGSFCRELWPNTMSELEF